MREHRDKSERLTFDFDRVESDSYSKVTSEVASHFDLEVITKKVNGLNEVFQDFKRGNEVVGLEWDIWSGYIVNAKTKSAESLVREIAGYISAKFNS
jgi:hypothetical protein